MHHKAKVGIDTRKHSFKQKVAFLHPMQKMRKKTDLAWKDFFENNPGKKKEDVWRRVKEGLRSKQNSTDKDKEVYAKETLQTRIVSGCFDWNYPSHSFVVQANRLETILLHNGNRLHFGLGSLYDHPVCVRVSH